MLNSLNLAAIKVKVFLDTAIYNFKNKEKGAVDIVAIIILIAVAVAVALIFKDSLVKLVKNIMGTVGSQAEKAISDVGNSR